MAEIEARLAALGLQLPAPIKLPPNVVLNFSWIRLFENRAFISGHGALALDGSLAEPRGKIGEDLTPEQGYQAARLTGLAVLASLKAAIGDLDRVAAWLLRVFGMVNAGKGFNQFPSVINGFSDLLWTCMVRSAAVTRAPPSVWPDCRLTCPWRLKPKSP